MVRFLIFKKNTELYAKLKKNEMKTDLRYMHPNGSLYTNFMQLLHSLYRFMYIL